MNEQKFFYDVLIEHPKLADLDPDTFIVFETERMDVSKIYFTSLSFKTSSDFPDPHRKIRVSVGAFENKPSLETLIDTFFLAVIDIDVYKEGLVEEIVNILKELDIPPSYILKTDKGLHIIYLSQTLLIKEDKLNVFALHSACSQFKRFIKLYLDDIVPIDKVMICDGYFTRLDAEVVYEGYIYQNFYDWYFRFYRDEAEDDSEVIDKKTKEQFDIKTIFENQDFITNPFLKFYDVQYIFNYVKFNCPTLNYILNNFENHTYDEWKIAVWFYYFLYNFIAQEDQKEKLLSDLLNKATLYRKHPPEVSIKRTKKFFEWFLKKNIPDLFWSCKKMNEVFGCSKCPHIGKIRIPFIPDFILPESFIVFQDKYYVLVNHPKLGEYYTYVCQFFYPLSVVMTPWGEKSVKIKIITFFNHQKIELVVSPDLVKGLKEADKFMINDKKHFLALIRFFNSNLLRVLEQSLIGVYPAQSQHKYITIEDFSLFTDQEHEFGNLVVEKKGSYDNFAQAIDTLLYDFTDEEYFHYKMAVILALFSIFYFRYYRQFVLNPGFVWFGTSGVGKTTCIKIINSFFREPTKMYEANFESITEAWINRKASIIRAPLFVDDVKVNNVNEFKTLFNRLYQLANRNLTKLNVQFTGSGNFYWILFLTSELRFVYRFVMTDGLNRRFFFINAGFKHTKLQEIARNITERVILNLEDNYGHGFTYYEKFIMPYEEKILDYMNKHGKFYEIFDIGVHNKILRCLEAIAQIMFKDEKRAEGLIYRFFRTLINKPFKPLTKQEEFTLLELAEKYPYVYDTLFDEETILSFLKDFSEIKQLADTTLGIYEVMNILTKICFELNMFYNLLFANIMLSSNGELKYVYPDLSYNLFYQVLIENKSVEILIEQILLIQKFLKQKLQILREVGLSEKFYEYLERIDFCKGLTLYENIKNFEEKMLKTLKHDKMKISEDISENNLPF